MPLKKRSCFTRPGRPLLSRQFIALIFVVLFCAAVGLKEPRFFGSQSIESVLLWMPIFLVAGIGQLLVILSGGIDISIGSILGFAGIGTGLIMRDHPTVAVPLILLAGLGMGLALGALNASLIALVRIPPLIVTIGTLAAFRGLTFLISKGDQIDSSMIPDTVTGLASKGLAIASVNFSWLLIIALLAAATFGLLLRHSRPGRNLIAFGSSANSAHLRGINGQAITFWVYVISGACAGLAGVMYAAKFGFVNPGSAGQNLELTVIAAVAIGGTKLTGGSGSVLGVLLGCLLLSCINVGLSILGIDANWQVLAYGVVILLAIFVDAWAERRQKV